MKPNHIELANHYCHDAVDLLVRFNYCWQSDLPDFSSIRSRRGKLYVDLAMSLECSHKSIKAYFEYKHLGGEELAKAIRKLSHKLNGFKPQEHGFVFSSEKLTDFFNGFIEQSEKLRIDLRYRIDNWNFREAEEQFYYETIGSDVWMNNLFQIANEISDWQRNQLSKESRVMTITDLFSELLTPKYNTYSCKQT